jgi:hypothetical protein
MNFAVSSQPSRQTGCRFTPFAVCSLQSSHFELPTSSFNKDTPSVAAKPSRQLPQGSSVAISQLNNFYLNILTTLIVTDQRTSGKQS